MSDRDVDFLLVGGGMAAAQCAAELRRGSDGSILLVGREPDPPYDRPPLSKGYLRGEEGREAALAHEPGWYEDNDVELLTGRNVIGLDLDERTAKLQGGETVGFGKALVATGAMVNILRVDGAELDGIHYLRAFGNSDKIREDVESAEHVVLVGGSYIGSEVAASLTELGKRCTIVMQEEVALSRPFGEDAGRYLHELLESKGIELYGGQDLAGYGGSERVELVRTAQGLEIPCDAVVVGAGVKPDVMLAQRAGLEVDDGIVCDSGLETSAAGVFAAGDCCSYESEIHGRRLRIEHTDVAFHQGRHAAKGMLGDKRPYRVVPYFFSDLSDWAAIEYVGPAASWDREVWRGDRAAGEFSVLYLEGERCVAALSIGRPEDLQAARGWIEQGRDLGAVADRLEDPGTELDQL